MVGKIVISKAGHDKDSIYVVVSCEGDYLYLADGRLKKTDTPKKKKRKHVQLTNSGAGKELEEALIRKEPNLDDKVKYAIKCYQKSIENRMANQ